MSSSSTLGLKLSTTTLLIFAILANNWCHRWLSWVFIQMPFIYSLVTSPEAQVRFVFLSWSKGLGKGPSAPCLKGCYNPLIYCLDKRGDVWKKKNHFDIEMKITNERRKSGSIINNKQNFESYVILLAGLLNFATIVIQEVILKEELGHPWLLIAPAVHWECTGNVLLICPEVLCVPNQGGFPFVARLLSCPEKPWNLASLWTQVLPDIYF